MEKTVRKSREESTDLPLFFKNPAPLDAERHATAGLLTAPDFSFAANTNSILVNAVEFYEAAKYYPIVFTQAEMPVPAIMVGLEQDSYFVDARGQWKEGTYIPGYARKYPFIFMSFPSRDDHILCIDEGAPQFKAGGGKGTLPLFQQNLPSDISSQALTFCGAYQREFMLTRSFCDAVQKAGLFEPMRFDVTLTGGREIHMAGFQAISEKKLQALPDATILEFFKRGWLPLIYASLMSVSNWKSLAELAAKKKNTKAK